jgi:chlorophyll synthase
MLMHSFSKLEVIMQNVPREPSAADKTGTDVPKTTFPSDAGNFETLIANTSGIRRSASDGNRKKISKLQLLLLFLKPITWVPVMWSFVCGCVASGQFGWSNLLDVKFWLGILVTGPLATGTCQMLNDYFDRNLDAINEPTRPIPAGDISLGGATTLITVWASITVVVGLLVNKFLVAHAVLGVVNAHLYSANPIKLKKRLWAGNIIVAFSYLVYPWMAGEIVYRGSFSMASTIAALCYFIASTGTMTVNDFKSISGDTRVGIRTLPVVYGEAKAALIAMLVIDLGQALAAAQMFYLGKWQNGLVIVAFMIPQVLMQRVFIQNPRKRDVWYNGIAQNFLVAAMLVSALGAAGF